MELSSCGHSSSSPGRWLEEDIPQLIEVCRINAARQQSFHEILGQLKIIADRLPKYNGVVLGNVDLLTTSQAIKTERETIAAIITRHPNMSKLHDGMSVEVCRKELEVARKRSEEIQNMRSEILKHFDRDIFNVDHENMLGRYKLEYSSFLKYLKMSYYKDQRQMRLLYTSNSQKLDDSSIVATLQTLKDIDHIRADITEGCKSLIDVFADSFKYEETDFDAITSVFETYECLSNAIKYLGELDAILSAISLHENALKQRFGIYQGIDTAWHKIIDALEMVASFRKQIIDDGSSLMPYYIKDHEELNETIIFKTLTHLADLKQGRNNCALSYSGLISAMGDVFKYEDTDFQLVDKYIQTYNHLVKGIQLLANMNRIMKEIASQKESMNHQYGHLYTGIMTDWNAVRAAIVWTEGFKEVIQEYLPDEQFIQLICSDANAVAMCAAWENDLSDMLVGIDADFQWFLGLFEDKDQYVRIDIRSLSQILKTYIQEISQLEAWVDYVRAKQGCEKEGLSDFIRKIETANISSNEIVSIFQKRFYSLWLDAVLPKYPSVMNFRRADQDVLIRDFSRLDKIQFRIASERIRMRRIQNMPDLTSIPRGATETRILKQELGKTRRIMPLRKLFSQIPNILLAIKPCLMMSPLSVSLYIDAKNVQFDTIIFDEASQVTAENAIGAIARGRQVIIAGDSKQLPPTAFFINVNADTDNYDNEEDEDNINDNSAFESILDLAVANQLVEKTLLWHYRSRHEHLIAFSNAKIYNNKLITFPSANDRAEDSGVEYIYVKDGIYDKGNLREAERVTELVFEHFTKHPKRSLGVVAFGNSQQQAIEDAIRAKRMQSQEFEKFFDEEKSYPFFIKNLENVQGDERDTIIFSIGYARSPSGVFRMNFGPLTQKGGERRLNVAITRAKYNVKLVGSIMPDDINVGNISNEGPKLLRAYIDFARRGMVALENEIKDNGAVCHESPFEESVYNFLVSKGYDVVTQVGCSGYRIDMAVKHPEHPEKYILGIECDGASYHSARTARERDRLRQDVLENMGWQIYRVWSTDWIKHPDEEGKRLIFKIQTILNSNIG